MLTNVYDSSSAIAEGVDIDAFKAAAEEMATRPRCMLVIEPEGAMTTLREDSIQEVSVERSVGDSDAFTYGSTVAGCLRFSVLTGVLDEVVGHGSAVDVYMGFEIEGSDYFVKLGRYFVDDNETDRGLMFSSYVAYDILASEKANTVFHHPSRNAGMDMNSAPGISLQPGGGTHSIIEVLQNAARAIGVNVAALPNQAGTIAATTGTGPVPLCSSIGRGGTFISQALELDFGDDSIQMNTGRLWDFTIRDLLSRLAMLVGCNVITDENGDIKLVAPGGSNSAYTITKRSYQMNGFVFGNPDEQAYDVTFSHVFLDKTFVFGGYKIPDITGRYSTSDKVDVSATPTFQYVYDPSGGIRVYGEGTSVPDGYGFHFDDSYVAREYICGEYKEGSFAATPSNTLNPSWSSLFNSNFFKRVPLPFSYNVIDVPCQGFPFLEPFDALRVTDMAGVTKGTHAITVTHTFNGAMSTKLVAAKPSADGGATSPTQTASQARTEFSVGQSLGVGVRTLAEAGATIAVSTSYFSSPSRVGWNIEEYPDNSIKAWGLIEMKGENGVPMRAYNIMRRSSSERFLQLPVALSDVRYIRFGNAGGSSILGADAIADSMINNYTYRFWPIEYATGSATKEEFRLFVELYGVRTVGGD